jgi:hypothetical protein
MTDRVHPPNPRACDACPWRLSNAGKASPLVTRDEGGTYRYGWYTTANLRRLWRGLRSGSGISMTCHPTDAQSGAVDVHPSVQTHECAGATILIQRELQRLSDCGDYRRYRRAHPRGLTRDAVRGWLERLLFGPVGLAARTERLDLNDTDVQHLAELKRWTERQP